MRPGLRTRECQSAAVPAARAGASARGPLADRRAFSLLEVIIACAIFFMVAFAILNVVTTGLASARRLQQHEPDAGMLAAALSLTNSLVEGGESGTFEDIAEGLYPGYSWSKEVLEIGSNGLFRVDFVVYKEGGRQGSPSESRMSILLYRPGSPPGSATKGRQ